MASSLQNRLMRLGTQVHVYMYRRSGGNFGGKIAGNPVLLLTTTGWKTGIPRTTPVMYIHKDNEYLIAASAAGADQNPAWFSNLASKPEAAIEVNGKRFKVKAVIASGEERDKLYENFKAMGKNFAEYEKKTTRKIPVIRLQPITT